MSAHDQWLASYRRGSEEVWCSNTTCPNHADGYGVEFEVEYGVSTVTPEECPECHGAWLYDKPEEE